METKLTLAYQADMDAVRKQHNAIVLKLEKMIDESQHLYHQTLSEKNDSTTRITELLIAQKEEIDQLMKDNTIAMEIAVTNMRFDRDNHYNSIIGRYDEQMNSNTKLNEDSIKILTDKFELDKNEIVASFNTKHAGEISVIVSEYCLIFRF